MQSRLKLNLNLVADFLLSARGIISILGKLAIVLTFWFAFEAGGAISAAFKVKIPKASPLETLESGQQKKQPPRSDYNVISDRSIIGRTGGSQQTSAPLVVSSKLRLRLVGTNIGTHGKFALIQDEAKKNEDVFELNERVFDQATLLEILPDSVRLDHNGKIEVLNLDTDTDLSKGGPSDGGVGAVDAEATEFTVPEEEVSNALANLPVLLSQARAVPFFKNGQSVGMRLFAITKGSLYEKVGLRNGDIIKSVNDASITDPAQAIKLFEQLKSERAITVVVERDQKDMELRYTIR